MNFQETEYVRRRKEKKYVLGTKLFTEKSRNGDYFKRKMGDPKLNYFKRQGIQKDASSKSIN